jgi:hypothetical protein
MPNPPKKLADGVEGGALGYSIVNLPKAAAKILATNIIMPTLGLQVRGAVAVTASRVEVNTRYSP